MRSTGMNFTDEPFSERAYALKTDVQVFDQVGRAAVGDVEELHPLSGEGVAVEQRDQLQRALDVAAVVLDQQQVGRIVGGIGGAFAQERRDQLDDLRRR